MKRAIACACVVAMLSGCGGDSEPGEPKDVVGPAPETPPRMCPMLGEPRAAHDEYLERARRTLVGRALGEAEALADAAGCRLVAAVIDGEPQILTREYDPTRIQAAVRDGEVVRVIAFG